MVAGAVRPPRADDEAVALNEGDEATRSRPARWDDGGADERAPDGLLVATLGAVLGGPRPLHTAAGCRLPFGTEDAEGGGPPLAVSGRGETAQTRLRPSAVDAEAVRPANTRPLLAAVVAARRLGGLS